MKPFTKLNGIQLGRLNLDLIQKAEKKKLILVLDNIRSLHNVGSAFRTADAFLIEAIYLCGITGTPPQKEIEKTALGATESVTWKYFKTTLEAIEELKQNQYYIVAIEQCANSTPLNIFLKKSQPTALIFGNEVYGVDQTVLNEVDECVEIPQFGIKHSFNVSVTIGIVLWEILN